MKKVFLLNLFLSLCIFSHAQKGGFVSVLAYPQIVNIKSSYDTRFNKTESRLGKEFTLDPTIGYGFGMMYYNIMSEYFGIKTGLLYSTQGQNFSSTVNADTTKGFDIKYQSRVKLNYLKLPILTHFTIIDENTPTYFTLKFGFQVGLLTAASFTLDANDYRPNYDINALDAFKRFEVSYVIGGDLHIKLNKQETVLLLIGVQFDKTIGNIDNYKYKADAEAPLEHKMPIGTLKAQGYSVPSDRNQYSTKNETFAVRSGIIFKVHN